MESEVGSEDGISAWESVLAQIQIGFAKTWELPGKVTNNEHTTINADDHGGGVKLNGV